MNFAPYRGMNGGVLPPGSAELAALPGQYLMQGLAALGRGAGNAMASYQKFSEQKQEEEKKLAELGKAAELVAKNVPEFADSVGGYDAFKNLGRREQIAAFKGFSEAATIKQIQSQIAAQRQKQQVDAAQLQALQREQQQAATFPAFARELARQGQPVEQQPGLGVLRPEILQQYSQPPTAMTPFLAAARTGYQPSPQELNAYANMVEAGNKGQGAFSATDLAQLGFIPTGGQVNPNGTASIQFGPPAAPPSTDATPITSGGKPTGKAMLDGKVIDLPDPTKATQADQTFRVNVSELQAKLDQMEELVKKFGNFETWSPEAAALLPQLQYSIAINYAKAVDPTSVAREGEVAAAQKYMLPLGMTTRNATTLAAIKNMREEITRRAKTFNQTAITPSGQNAGAAETGESGSNQSAPKARKYNPATGRIE